MELPHDASNKNILRHGRSVYKYGRGHFAVAINSSPRIDRKRLMSQCPICSKPTVAATAPFCSPRCREVDFNRWFTGAYAVPAVELDDIDEESLEEAAKLNPENFEQ